jgi:hypothetical protein
VYWKSRTYQIVCHTWSCAFIFIGFLTLASAAQASVSAQVAVQNTKVWGSGFQGKVIARNTGTSEISDWPPEL